PITDTIPKCMIPIGDRPLSKWRKHLTFVLIAITVPVLAACDSSPPQSSSALQKNGTDNGVPVCGQPILKSPFDYHGATGPYRSGTRGLPTFGSPRSNFPKVTAGYVLPADSKYYPSYVLQPNTVYYLLPGTHVNSIQADPGDVFVGGFA